MPNSPQQTLEHGGDAVPGQRPFCLPWQRPNLAERAHAAQPTFSGRAQEVAGEARARLSDMPLQIASAAQSARQAVAAAERAERAADRATSMVNQLSEVVGRLLVRRGHDRTSAALRQEPDQAQIRLGEAAGSRLTHAADSVARAVEAVGGTLYDYSAGHYGVPPLTAGELRHERERESKEARPVAVIEGRFIGRGRRGRSWLPPLALSIGLATAVGVGVWRRRHLQQAASRAMEMGRQAIERAGQQTQPRSDASFTPPSPTLSAPAHAFGSPADRFVRGDTLPSTGATLGEGGMERPAKGTA